MRFTPLLLLTALATAADEDYRSTAPANQTPMLGVEMTPVPSHIQDREGLTPHQGVLVQSTYAGTAAEGMGLQRDDVILRVNDTPIGSMTELRNEVGLTSVGDPIKVTVTRNGQVLELESQVREWPATIPREKIDAAGERRFRDFQDRRQRRQEEDLRRLSREADDVRRQLAGEDSRHERPHRASSAGGGQVSADDDLQFPAVRFAFRIDVRSADVDASQAEALAEVPNVRLPDGLPTDQPWKVSTALTTPATTPTLR